MTCPINCRLRGRNCSRSPIADAGAGLAACAVGPELPAADGAGAGRLQGSIKGWKLGRARSRPASGAAWWSVYDDPRARPARAADRRLQPEPEGGRGRRTARRRALVSRGARRLLPDRRRSTPRRSGLAPAAASNGRATRRAQYQLDWAPRAGSSTSGAASAARSRASDASAQASAADLAAARLSAQSALATDYFELRDRRRDPKRLLDATADAFSTFAADHAEPLRRRAPRPSPTWRRPRPSSRRRGRRRSTSASSARSSSTPSPC